MADPFIRSLQQLLKARGANIAVDGMDGPATRAALTAFQKQSGLPVSGMATQATLTALQKPSTPDQLGTGKTYPGGVPTPTQRPPLTSAVHGGNPQTAMAPPGSADDHSEVATDVLSDPNIAARVKTPMAIDRTHDIPYGAGYSTDGNTLFIDRRFPTSVTINGQKVDPTPFILRHEAVEKALIDGKGYSYQAAHQIATSAENAAWKAAGIDPQAAQAAMHPYLQQTQARAPSVVPWNLDLTPYRDAGATSLLDQMFKATEPHPHLRPGDNATPPSDQLGSGKTYPGGVPTPTPRPPPGPLVPPINKASDESAFAGMRQMSPIQAPPPQQARFAQPPPDVRAALDATTGDRYAETMWRNSLPPVMGGIQTGGMGNPGLPQINEGGTNAIPHMDAAKYGGGAMIGQPPSSAANVSAMRPPPAPPMTQPQQAPAFTPTPGNPGVGLPGLPPSADVPSAIAGAAGAAGGALNQLLGAPPAYGASPSPQGMNFAPPTSGGDQSGLDDLQQALDAAAAKARGNNPDQQKQLDDALNQILKRYDFLRGLGGGNPVPATPLPTPPPNPNRPNLYGI